MIRPIRAVLALALAAGLAACASDPDPAASVGPGAGGAAGAGLSSAPLDPQSEEYFRVTVGDRVFFETDSASLEPQARDTLTAQAAWLRQNPGTRVTIEGHADERGTRDYNLALGARRAQAARDFLLAQGVSAGRMNTVSFGKERPVSLCSNESCWSQNRRAVTVVAGAPTS
jgi:peptidoglycan-associated lipoprotein